MEITKQDFESYEAVRTSGVTNMYAVNVVCDISGLSREQAMQIMKEYTELCKKYPGVREGTSNPDIDLLTSARGIGGKQ